MHALANPTMRPELLTQAAVLRHRSLFCPEYDACLSVAADAGWPSWSCERCPLARVTAMPRPRLRRRALPVVAEPPTSGLH